MKSLATENRRHVQQAVATAGCGLVESENWSERNHTTYETHPPLETKFHAQDG